jgi:hypothetical protein
MIGIFGSFHIPHTRILFCVTFLTTLAELLSPEVPTRLHVKLLYWFCDSLSSFALSAQDQAEFPNQLSKLSTSRQKPDQRLVDLLKNASFKLGEIRDFCASTRSPDLID